MAMWDWMVERSIDFDVVRRNLTDLIARPVYWFDLENPPTRLESIPDDGVLCWVRVLPGQFPTVVSCFGAPGAPAEWEIVALFSRAVHARCLLSDDTIIPFRWLLADATGKVRPIHVDIADTDQGEEFTVRHDCSVRYPSCQHGPCQTSATPADTVLTVTPNG